MTKLHIDNKKAAESVQAQIEAIQNISLSSKNELDTAKNSYDALTERQKSMVTNYSKLREDFKKYNELNTQLEISMYKADVIPAIVLINTAMDSVNEILFAITSAWDEAQSIIISNGYDTNIALIYLKATLSAVTNTTDVQAKLLVLEGFTNPQIEENIEKVKNSPDSCKNIYEDVINLYNSYLTLYDIMSNPVGTYSEYTKKVEEGKISYNANLINVKKTVPEAFQ